MTFLSYAGNTMIILVMTSSQSQPRAKTTRILFSFLAINDMCFMTLDLLKMMLFIGLIKTRADLRIAFILMLAIRDYSNWILVVISTERFLCIFRPLTVKNCCHKRCVITVLVTIFCTLVGLGVFLQLYNSFLFVVCFELSVSFASPLLILTVETIFIVVKLRKMGRQPIRRNAQKQPNNSATGLLIAANICFIITMLPFRAIYLLRLIDINPEYREILTTVTSIVLHLMTLNYVLNFYLYFAFNANFRRDTFKLIGYKQITAGQSTNDE